MSNQFIIENSLKKLFRDMFKARPDLGKDFFEGSLSEMKHLALQTIGFFEKITQESNFPTYIDEPDTNDDTIYHEFKDLFNIMKDEEELC